MNRNISYDAWVKQVAGEFLSRTGLELNDCFEADQLLSSHQARETPPEVVDREIEKYGLTDLKSEPWERYHFEHFSRQAFERFGYASK